MGRGVFWPLLLLPMVLLSCLSRYFAAGADSMPPHRILVDTDVNVDDILAFVYLLKQNRSEFNLEAITISANTWCNAGHAVNHLYDVLHMMGRNDIPVGVGGEGGILLDGTILPNVGGYLPIIDQDNSTIGGCRYRQSTPPGQGGRLDVDTNYGMRREFLQQGKRSYSPLRQPTVQKIMFNAISSGSITIFLIGSHTNLAIFLMTYPHLKKNIDHIYIMGGGVRSQNPSGCCPKNDTSCMPQQCGNRGNLYTGYMSNPYAEFNIFIDPFAAYQVLHSGIPVTLVPLDATNTIPITEEFFVEFQSRHDTYEANYCFQSLKMVRDTWFDDKFYSSYFMWDPFMVGIALSTMKNKSNPVGENDFSEMEYLNITVITSNEPYCLTDGSNPFFDGHDIPKFNLQKCGIHSGHVQVSLRDPFCYVEGGKGSCKDGYTKETSILDSVRVLVAKKAKPNRDIGSPLNREFLKSFLDVLNLPLPTRQFNSREKIPSYKEIVFQTDLSTRKSGKPVVFDMDMSVGDFIALICLLKAPAEVIDIKAVFVSCNGWANAATVDVIYDILHMMGRDDIPVGLGSFFALEQPYPFYRAVGDCKYIKAIPHGCGGFLDSDTIYGLAHTLPRSPRRYTAENSVDNGAPRDTERPELRQPLALEVWHSTVEALENGQKITILANGPLTNLANILSEKNSSSIIESVYIVGGHIIENKEKGNLFSVPSNKYAEFNMFLDPLAAKMAIDSKVDITLIPLRAQNKVASFPALLEALQKGKKTPEAVFTHCLLSRLYRLQMKDERYHHMTMFLGEVLGAFVVANYNFLNLTTVVKPISVLATGNISTDGQSVIDKIHGRRVKVVENIDSEAYYYHFSKVLGDELQSAALGSSCEPKEIRKRTNMDKSTCQSNLKVIGLYVGLATVGVFIIWFRNQHLQSPYIYWAI